MKRFHYIRRTFAVLLAAAILTPAAMAEPETPAISSDITTSMNESSDSTDVNTDPESSTISQPEESSEELSSTDSSEADSSSLVESSESVSDESSLFDSSTEPAVSSAPDTAVSANTSSRSYQPTPTVSPEWNEELNAIYNNACDWLKQNQGDAYFFIAMGGAGVPIDSRQYSYFLSTVSDHTYTDLYNLSLAVTNATFCGIKADNINGIDLISQITNFSSIEDSDTMGIAFALLALDSNPYEISADSKNNRMDFVNLLLKRQKENGSFHADDKESPLSVTALSLSALSKYSGTEAVNNALNNGVNYLQTQYNQNRFRDESIATISRIISALSCLKININDSRFSTTTRNFTTELQNYLGSDGGFKSLPADSQSDIVATELTVIALTSIKYLSSPYVTQQSLPDSSSSQPRIYDYFKSEFPLWAIMSIIVGGVLLLGGCAVVLLVMIKHKKKEKQTENQQE